MHIIYIVLLDYPYYILYMHIAVLYYYICTMNPIVIFKYLQYNYTIMGLKENFESGKYWGILTSIDLFECDPKPINSEKDIKDFVVALCDLIDMKRYGDCQIYRFGSGDKEGYTFLQLIETSLISGHFAAETNNAYIDVFSCKYYDPTVVADFAKAFFFASDCLITVTPRHSNMEDSGFKYREAKEI